MHWVGSVYSLSDLGIRRHSTEATRLRNNRVWHFHLKELNKYMHRITFAPLPIRMEMWNGEAKLLLQGSVVDFRRWCNICNNAAARFNRGSRPKWNAQSDRRDKNHDVCDQNEPNLHKCEDPWAFLFANLYRCRYTQYSNTNIKNRRHPTRQRVLMTCIMSGSGRLFDAESTGITADALVASGEFGSSSAIWI